LLALHKTQTIATDGVAWSVCVCVCLCVCLSVTCVRRAETAEPIEMPFEGLTQMGPRNRILDVVYIPSWLVSFNGAFNTIQVISRL